MPQPLARRSGPLRPRPVLEEPASSPLSAWLLNGPLTAAFGLVAVLQLVTWLPHYLTWPYWADHDVFAHAARAWTRGALPYRDTPLNNFPGTIYLFLILGKAFGWGRPPAFFAFDAGLLLLLGATLAVWSKRRFGSLLPAAVGWLTWTSTYLSLDMAHAAQRDWQGPAFAVLGLLLLQTRRSPGACVAAGLLAAFAFSIRPQTILLMPAAWAMLIADGDGPPLRQGRSRRIGLWAGGLAAGLAAVFAPLLVAGVFGDFIQGVRLAAYGGGYNRVTPVGFVRNWFLQAAVWRWWALALAAGMIARLGGSASARLATPWLVALAGVSLYKPVSPVAHSYLELPIELVAAVCTALLAGLLLVAPVRREFQVAGILLALGLGPTTLRPEFCVAGPTSRRWQAS
ncbi:MAG: hypothetical protein U0835_07050 [Isosphaeraceae bacterium]